jgi:hypothetical protein
MGNTFLRNPSVETAPLQEEMILFDPARNKFCLLNRTAAFLWVRLEKPQTAEDLAGQVCAAFENVELEQASKDTRAALDELLALHFIEAA